MRRLLTGAVQMSRPTPRLQAQPRASTFYAYMPANVAEMVRLSLQEGYDDKVVAFSYKIL